MGLVARARPRSDFVFRFERDDFTQRHDASDSEEGDEDDLSDVLSALGWDEEDIDETSGDSGEAEDEGEEHEDMPGLESNNEQQSVQPALSSSPAASEQ